MVLANGNVLKELSLKTGMRQILLEAALSEWKVSERMTCP